MTNSKHTKKALLTSFLSLLLCVSMLIGTTFAWFTDNVSSVNNIITAGNLDVELYYQNDTVKNWKPVDDNSNVFKENTLWEPGHTEVVYLKVKNAGTLALKYQLSINVASEKGSINVKGENFLLSSYIQYAAVLDCKDQFDNRVDARKEVANAPIRYLHQAFVQKDLSLKAGEEAYLAFVVYMPEEVGNEANYKKGAEAPYINLGINLMATQYTHEEDSFGKDYDAAATYWDTTADTTWYDPDAVVYELSTPYQLAGLMKLVDDGITFEGKTVRLATDIDLYVEDKNGEPICFDPIGSYRFDKSFKGTFDGQGNAIKNLNQNTWALNNGYYYNDCGLGLFGAVEDATVKNLVMDGASISGESALCGVVAAVAHNTTFENITVKNSNCADYQYYAGGIVGWASGELTFNNCTVDETTTVAGQWGDFDNSNGGLIGGASGSAKILVKDTTIACRIDAYNDVTSSYQWYAYRRSGMIIGNSGKTTTSASGSTVAAAPQLTCENVTVIYGDWANYTYCAFAGTSWPYVRVQKGVSNSAYSNPRYGHPTDANGNEVVDDNHVHNDGEAHQILCAFDQLYGGGQGVYGTATHPGVTVEYKAYTVDNKEALNNALNKGQDVKLHNDIEVESGDLMMHNGIFDGNNNVIKLSSGTSTMPVLGTTGGTIQNVILNGSGKFVQGIGAGMTTANPLTKDLYIKNVTVDEVMYAVIGTANDGVKVVVSDSNLYGAFSYIGATIEISDSTLGAGKSMYDFFEVAGDTTFANCSFVDSYCFMAYAEAAGSKVTFTDCTVNGTDLTADNFKSLLVDTRWDYSSDLCSTNLKNCTIIVDGVEVVW